MASEKENTGRPSLSKRRNDAPQGEPKEVLLRVHDLDVLRDLVGDQGGHLKIIESRLEIRAIHSQEGIILKGHDAEVDLAYDLLQQLQPIIKSGEKITNVEVERAIHSLSENRKFKLSELFYERVKVSGRLQNVTPKTAKQREYIEAMRSYDVVFGIGPAGTGKTYVAMAMAVSALLNKECKRIVLCRPAVEAGEKLGFLPGDMAEKVNPYLRPLYDALHDMIDHERAHELVEKGVIEVAPLAFMRGRTLSNAFVILDEAQNTTVGQMKMLLTRLGRNSKCFVTGDITQIDLPPGIRSGLDHALDVLENVQDIAMIYFGEDDVIRHPLVSKIVKAYRIYDEGSN